MPLTAQIYLSFNGQCQAALNFYERSLNATVVSKHVYGGSPMAAEAPPGWDDKIMHSTIRVGDTLMAAADVAPNKYETPKGFSILLEMNDVAEAERIFHALSENARVDMPIQETFWATRFGALVDQFGIPWSINCE